MSSNPSDAFAARLKREREENPIFIDPASLDGKVKEALPDGATILSIIPSGASAWCDTVRIDTKLSDGTEKKYFKKQKSGEAGRLMMEGSYKSEAEYYKYCPDHVPKPLAYGELESKPGTYFYLCEFYDMVDELPDAQSLVSIVSKVHRDSMGKSDRYGFECATYLADIPNDNTWQDSWEVWYLQAMKHMKHFETRIHGQDDELDELFNQFCEKVVPRLLRPLETGGRHIQPCLIHSDLWPGNVMPDADTGELVLFDSCAYWGHNESDLGTWRQPRYKFGRPFAREYQKSMGISEPHADWDDRNAVYAIRYDLLSSGLYPNEIKFRNLAKSEMKRLIEKHPKGVEGFSGSLEPNEKF